MKVLAAFFFKAVLLVVVNLGTWPFIVFNRDFRQGVASINGLNLGYSAVFDLSGLTLSGLGRGSYGTELVMRALLKRPEYQSQWRNPVSNLAGGHRSLIPRARCLAVKSRSK